MEKTQMKIRGGACLSRQVAVGLVLTGTVFLGLHAAAHAGTTGTEFQGAYDTVMDIADGYGGKLVALGAFVAGIVGGIARQSPMIFASAAATSIAVGVGPGVVDSLVGAMI